MGLLEYLGIEHLRERFRQELPVNPEIVERERRFSESDPSRESWILKHVYLCEGNLVDLKQHPDFDPNAQGLKYVISYYQTKRGRGPCKNVVVRVTLDSNVEEAMSLVERKLKLDLHSRGSNAGVFYKTYKKGDFLYAQTVPAMVTGE